jgi:hypothetical protein
MTRVLRYFKKTDESYAGEITVDIFSIEELRVYFGIEGENPMFDSFPVLSDIDSEFKNKLDIDLDFEKYDYFLEYN